MSRSSRIGKKRLGRRSKAHRRPRVYNASRYSKFPLSGTFDTIYSAFGYILAGLVSTAGLGQAEHLLGQKRNANTDINSSSVFRNLPDSTALHLLDIG